MKTKLIILTMLLFVTAAAYTEAQQPASDRTSPEGPKSSLTINEDNFACFKNLHCLKDENLFRNNNLDMVKNSNSRYEKFIVEGSTENEELFAEYDHRGNLIRSTVIQRNIPLPGVIRMQLIDEEFKSWKMIGNERVIYNFDSNSIEYKLILQKDDNIRVVYFDHKGQNKNRLT